MTERCYDLRTPSLARIKTCEECKRAFAGTYYARRVLCSGCFDRIVLRLPDRTESDLP